MANKRISELPAAGPLTGAELVELVQGGINEQSTAQAVANLATNAIDPYTYPFPQFTTATSTTAYTGTTAPAITAYATGQKFQVKVHATSTGASTLNLNGLGAKKVYTNPTTQATTGNLLVDQIYILAYDAALDAAAGGFLMVGGGSGGGGTISDVSYSSAWNGVTGDGASKNTLYDKIQTISERVYNVETFGAVHDAVTFTDGKITSGTDDFTSASATFTVADVGKEFIFAGAGAAGAVLRTTILAYVSATAVTLATNASTTVASTGKTFIYGTNDTPSIQAAINACQTAGGGKVYLPNGHYLISGALFTNVSGVNPNCQIYINPTNSTASDRQELVIEGESNNSFWSGYSTVSTPLKTTGVILTSTITGSGTRPAIIGCKGPAGSYLDFSFTNVTFKNLELRSFTNNGALPPSVSGINGQYLSFCSGDNINIGLDVILQSSSSSAAVESFGVIASAVNNGGQCEWKNMWIGGFKYGFVSGEHITMEHIEVFGCNNGFLFPTINYVSVGYILTHGCINQILFANGLLGLHNGEGGRSMVDILIEVEKDTFGYWFDTQTFIIDSANIAFGQVKYTYNIGDGTAALINSQAITTTTGALYLEIIPLLEIYGTGGVISGTVNNFASTNNGLAKSFSFNPSSNSILTGIDLDNYRYFRRFTIINTSASFTLTLSNENGGSLALNRFLNEGDYILGPNTSVMCVYDPDAASGVGRIRLMSAPRTLNVNSIATTSSTQQFPGIFTYTGALGSGGLYITATNTVSGPTFYMDNNTGGFSAYGGGFVGNTASATTLFGLSAQNTYFNFSGGATSAGMAIGTTSSDPFYLGTNDVVRARFLATGEFGVGVTSPTSQLHTTAFATAYVAKTALYTLTAADHTVEVTSGTHTQTLPTAVGITGRQYFITNSGSGTVTVATTSSQTFVNKTATPTTLTLAQFGRVLVQSNGSNWIIISEQ